MGGEPVGVAVLLADNRKAGGRSVATKATRTTSSSFEQCWAMVANAGALRGCRRAGSWLYTRRFSAALDFGAGVALGTGVAVHAGTVAATWYLGFVGIVVVACGVGDAVRWAQRGLGDPLR